MATILVVDDSETQRFELKHALEAAGYSVLEGKDGAEGLKQLEANPGVKLIICDVNMPVMDGLTMCAKILESGKYSGVPIFMLTTEVSPDLKEAGKKSGVRAWIAKPWQPEKLLAAAKKVIEKK